MAGDQFLLGYLAEYVSAQGVYFGGLLVTNERGLPREFRHTDSVRPSKLQLALYGDQMRSCVGSDAIAPVLYNELTQKPSVLLVDSTGRWFFGEFLIQHTPAALLVSASSDESIFTESLAPLGNIVDAIQLEHRGVANSYVFAYVDEENGNLGRRALEFSQSQMNLLSPFDRVRAVLQQVSEIDEGRKRK